jgi:hypothetical protein
MSDKPSCFRELVGARSAQEQCFSCEWFKACAEDRTTPTADAMLENAASTMRQRARDYDKPSGERSMGKCVSAFNTITGRDLSEAEGWLLLQVLKDVRQFQNPERVHADSLIDCIAYAALKAEAIMGEGK